MNQETENFTKIDIQIDTFTHTHQKHGEVLSLIIHQGNANKNHSKTPIQQRPILKRQKTASVGQGVVQMRHSPTSVRGRNWELPGENSLPFWQICSYACSTTQQTHS